MNPRLSFLLVAGFVFLCFIFTAFGCANNKVIEGVPATDLSRLYVGISRIDTETIIGDVIREYQCSSGTIVTYLYDRGWIGCGSDGVCKSGVESEKVSKEAQMRFSSTGTHHDFIAGSSSCIEPCQKGHLEAFFNQKNRLIGVRELPADRDVYCWRRGNKRHLRYPCNWIYDHPRPSSVPKSLILYIDPKDIPDKICEQFNK